MPDAPIGRGQYELSADRTQLTKDLAAAKGDVTKAISSTEAQAAQSTSKLAGLSGPAKAAIAGVGVVTAGAFAEVTKGALQAQEAQGKYMAATGQSREQAKAFVSDMDGLAGSAGTVGKSFEEITAVGTNVANQFGTTGKETQALTGQMLQYAQVTGSDATAATQALADAMAANHEPTANAAADMDLLVASHQKFKTDIGPGTLDIMAKLGPAVTLLGGDYSDTVGILNAFKVAGVDSAQATKDLNAAVLKLPPGTTLDGLITKLGAIKDPTERSRVAIDLLGKAGLGLATVIKPGMTSLDDFKVSAVDAKDATTKAADSMETDADKIKGAFDKLTAGAREVGQDFGPALSGLAAVGPLAGSLAGKFGGLIKEVATKVLPQATIAGATIGGAEGGAEAEAATGPKILQSFLAKFGLMTGAKVTAAAAAGAEEGAAEGEAAANTATTTSGKASSGITSNLAQIGGVVAGVTVGIDLINEAFNHVQTSIEGSTSALAGFTAATPAIAEQAHQTGDFAQHFADFLKLNPLTAWHGIAGAAQEAADAFHNVRTSAEEADFTASLAAGIDREKTPVIEAATTLGTTAGTTFTQVVASTAQNSAAGAFAAIGPAWASVVKANIEQPFYDLGKGTVSQFTQGLWDDRTALSQTASKLQDILKNGLSPQKQALEAEGKKYIELVDDGMESKKTGAKETAMQVAAAAIKSIEDTAVNGSPDTKGAKAIGSYLGLLFTGGLKADDVDALLKGQGLSAQAIQGIHDKYPQFFAAGSGAAVQVHTGLTSAGKGGTNPWQGYGYTVAGEWITGFANKFDAYNWANLINHSIGPNFAGQSPPKEGPLHDIDKWGYNVGDAYAGGMFKGIQEGTAKRAGGIPALLGTPPGLLQAATVVPAGVTPGGGVTHVHHWHIGTLVADDYGLKKLHSEMERVMTHWER